VESLLDPLLPLFKRERAADRPVALGVLVHTSGSTYRKAGALILVASNGEYAGLLSGGCVEGDLGQHARQVIASGRARLLTYDTRGGDDLIWGLGLGCEGAMRILLLRVGPIEDWQPLGHLCEELMRRQRTAVGIVSSSARPDLPEGTLLLPDGRAQLPGGDALAPAALCALRGAMAALGMAQASGQPGWFSSEDPERAGAQWTVFALPLTLPPQLLLLGAGPDAAPLVEFATRLHWRVTLADHRPVYAQAAHFPAADRVVLAPTDEILQHLDPAPFEAAVIMSHHFESDLAYLRALAGTSIGYVGLLGPAVRRERLLSALGSEGDKLRGRLRAPVGLPLGGRSPEEVALAIAAQIQGFLHEVRATARGDARPRPLPGAGSPESGFPSDSPESALTSDPLPSAGSRA
jgi:xanthine dehydrogenase accessory factor